VNGGAGLRPEAALRPQAALLIPGLLALAAFLVLLALGTWQVERKAWKEGLIAALDERLAAPPLALPPSATWSGLDPAQAEFRRVSFAAEFLDGQEALVYTSGSPLRTDVSGPGFWVFSPARLADGSVVVVNRGFVPEERQEAKSRPGGELRGRVHLVGALRWPEARSMFTPADDPARNLWFVRDHLAMAAAKGWGKVAPAGAVASAGAIAPFFVEQEAPVPPGGLPVVGRMHPNLPNDHLQYALTWYGLAGVLLVVFALRARSGTREKMVSR
jgi:surfeit locus 1 family protein